MSLAPGLAAAKEIALQRLDELRLAQNKFPLWSLNWKILKNQINEASVLLSEIEKAERENSKAEVK